MEAVKERPLTQEEKVEAVSAGLTELGATYKSHNEYNLYISIEKGSVLDNDVHKAKAKKTVLMYLGLILRIVD
jgi:hypothetical protein